MNDRNELNRNGRLRRNILIAGVGTSVLGLAGILARIFSNRRADYLSGEEIADVFRRYDIEPMVQSNGGKRTLIEVDFYFPETNLPLLDELQKHVKIKHLFFESMYYGEGDPDPYTQCIMEEASIFSGRAIDPQQIHKEDAQGYFLLSKRGYDCIGLEDRTIWHDYLIIRRIYYQGLKRLFPRHLEGKADKLVLNELRNLSERLIVAPSPIPEYPDEQNFHDEVYRALTDLEFRERGQAYVKAIDERLKTNEVGLIYAAPVFFKEYKDSQLKPIPTLHPQLKEKGIDTVYLEHMQAMEFVKKLKASST